MKRTLLCCIMMLLFTACGRNIQSTSAAKQPEPLSAQSVTEEYLLDLFHGYAYADPAERRVIDCVIMRESQHGILGVVQYICADQSGCQFDFIRHEMPPIQAGIDQMPLEGTLIYQGTDSISFQIQDEQGIIHVCCITYYQTAAEQGFRIKSELKEG